MRRKKKRGKSEKDKEKRIILAETSPSNFHVQYNIDRQSLREEKRKVNWYREQIGGIPLVQFVG